jgi:protein-disulfide isomerase
MQGFFLQVSITIFRMPEVSKATPLLIIIVAVAAAGGIALYLSRQGPTAQATDQITPSNAQSGGGRIRGAADAPVTLVEYGDYQCPTCGHYHPIIMELLSRYQGKLKLEYHHFPLISIHPHAMGAALAAEAAGDQGKFWEMHDLLFENQRQWGANPQAEAINAEAIFVQFALQLGLDANRFMQSMRSPEVRDRIIADVQRGNSIVKEGTPTFLINGQPVAGLPGLEGLKDRIDGQLAALVK